jgi:iron complex outermembrane receptor protein
MRLRTRLCSSAALAITLTSGAFAAHAQTDGTVAEVIVTATRRPEKLQNVPVAVTVVDGDRAARSNLNTLRDIATIVPTLNFRTAASNKDQALFIRGLGTVSTSPGVEPTVSTVIDGVVLARQGQATLDLLDVERIEVLRGPQGTLFGKNASGGVVNIVTKDPGQTARGYAEAFYGTGGDERRFKAGLSGPLVASKLAGSLGVFAGQYDGNVTNVFNGDKVNGYQRAGARGKLIYTPTEDLTLRLVVDYMAARDTAPTGVVRRTFLTAYPTGAVTTFPVFAAALSPVIPGDDNRQINSNLDTHARDFNSGASLQADWRLGEHTVTSVSAFRRWDNIQFQDQDRLAGAAVGLPQQHDRGDLGFEQLSQEIRLASPKGGLVEYVVGAYFMRATDDEIYRRETTTATATARSVFNGLADYGVTNNNYSVFGEATLNASSRLRLIAGLREVRDELRYRFQRVSSSPTPVTGIQTSFASAGSVDKTGYAARLGAQYALAGASMAYVTYSRGYKGPAYNVAFSMLPQDTGALNPETNDAYEAGLKSRLLGGRLQANLAGFLTNFSNYQVNFYDIYNGSPVTRLINAGKVSTRGVEADLAAKPAKDLSLSLTAAYIHARIDDFKCPVGTAASCQVNGKPLPFSPDWKLNARAEYRLPLEGAFAVDLTTEYSWQSKTQYSINQTPDTVQDAYGIWNAGVTVTAPGDWRFTVLAKNIADTPYSSMMSTFGSGVVRFVPRDDHRYFGFDLRKDF